MPPSGKCEHPTENDPGPFESRADAASLLRPAFHQGWASDWIGYDCQIKRYQEPVKLIVSPHPIIFRISLPADAHPPSRRSHTATSPRDAATEHRLYHSIKGALCFAMQGTTIHSESFVSVSTKIKQEEINTGFDISEKVLMIMEAICHVRRHASHAIL